MRACPMWWCSPTPPPAGCWPPTPCWVTSIWPNPTPRSASLGRRVIEQTIRETLPEEFQKSEFLMEHGMIDKVVARAELPRVLNSILKTLMMGRERLSPVA